MEPPFASITLNLDQVSQIEVQLLHCRAPPALQLQHHGEDTAAAHPCVRVPRRPSTYGAWDGVFTESISSDGWPPPPFDLALIGCMRRRGLSCWTRHDKVRRCRCGVGLRG